MNQENKPEKETNTKEKINVPFDPMKAVYCYMFTEVRNALHEVENAIPDEFYLVTTTPDDISSKINSILKTPLKIPVTPQGNIDLDNIQVPIIDRIVGAYSTVAPALQNFKHKYSTSGSSEGLFHILSRLKTEGVKEISVLRGEYEGFEIQAENLGLKVNRVDINDITRGSYYFISNPSARNGNIISNEKINEICDRNKVVMDLAYVGSTKEHVFDLSNKNITDVVMSFSKPYGLFRSRIGGFAFGREETKTLYGNKWFKDTLRLLQALKIAEDIGPNKLYDKYYHWQEKTIKSINDSHGIEIIPSDSFLLGYMNEKNTEKLSIEKQKLIAPYRRENNYRFCLTPYFERMEKEQITTIK